MDIIISNIDNLSALGLFWDGLGVLILGVTSIFKVKNEIAQEAGTYFDYNPHELKNKVASRMDISTGSIFLLIGFIFQFIASMSLKVPNEISIVFWIAALVLTSYYYIHGKSWLVNLWVKEIKNQYENKGNESS